MSELWERFLLGLSVIIIVLFVVLILRQTFPSAALPSVTASVPPAVAAAAEPVLAALPIPHQPPGPQLTPVADDPPGRDERYFPQTGFRIDDDRFWDYFTHRGGVATFGYPISRTFRFQGFQVQFFQRRIIQLDQNGHARQLNALDPELLPYDHFDGSAFPAYDPKVAASAPPATDLTATLAWVQAHAPDTFHGQPVHFYRTFLDTVPATTISPGGADPRLLAGFALEMWGVPTSLPQVNPRNHDVVYLRFQRGIMQYDAACGCTQAVLLADYLKKILTGTDLPADLDQEARNSPFYHQHDPAAPRAVHRPELLPETDLTNAFSQQ